MSEEKALSTELRNELGPSSDPTAEGHIQEKHTSEEVKGAGEEEGSPEDDDDEEEDKTEACSALSEPSTLPWPDDKLGLMPETEDSRVSSGKVRAAEEEEEEEDEEEEEEDEEESGGSQSSTHPEGGMKRRSQWRESMPEGERWRAYEAEGQQQDKSARSVADGEEDEDADDEDSVNWMPEKAALVFTPQVSIVNPFGGESAPGENKHYDVENVYAKNDLYEKEPPAQSAVDVHQYSDEKLKLCLAMVAALVLFPLLVWGGYALLPFDAPQIKSTPLRLVYTLRCAFFATVPIMLGVVVQGVARLRFRELKPLYQGSLESQEVAAHGHYVNDSLCLYLFYFLQLSVMATYLNQEYLKLVPLLTIIFAVGRLIYWVCLSLGSSVRALGFGFSFFPILLMLGVNLYYVFSSVGQGAVFDVEPPTKEPPPMQRWWG
ncbi:unnamed protein product [Merluccius merluccius]